MLDNIQDKQDRQTGITEIRHFLTKILLIHLTECIHLRRNLTFLSVSVFQLECAHEYSLVNFRATYNSPLNWSFDRPLCDKVPNLVQMIVTIYRVQAY